MTTIENFTVVKYRSNVGDVSTIFTMKPLKVLVNNLLIVFKVANYVPIFKILRLNYFLNVSKIISGHLLNERLV